MIRIVINFFSGIVLRKIRKMNFNFFLVLSLEMFYCLNCIYFIFKKIKRIYRYCFELVLLVVKLKDMLKKFKNLLGLYIR